MSATEKGKDKTPPRTKTLLEDRHVQVDEQNRDGSIDEGKSALSVAIQRNHAGQNKVIAKGSGELAEQILQIAFDHGIKVRTDSDLVEILSTVDVESEIPLEALTAVATILNYVYDEQKQSSDEPVN
ncbi:MAG: EscU/YscU/HrcU family type III secretion system export apparatus switch protein [Halopseudomonas aestusnigri]